MTLSPHCKRSRIICSVHILMFFLILSEALSSLVLLFKIAVCISED